MRLIKVRRLIKGFDVGESKVQKAPPNWRSMPNRWGKFPYIHIVHDMWHSLPTFIKA